MSKNEARHRDIAALLARGVIRVKKQPMAAKAIESHIPVEQSQQPDPSSDTGSIKPAVETENAVASRYPTQLGGD